MTRWLERIILGASGLVLAAVGIVATFATDAFYGVYSIDISGSRELASELRAVGVVLLLTGMLILCGLVWRSWVFPAAVIAATVALGLALGRAGSALVDGSPDSSIVTAGVIELLLGAGALWVAVRNRPRPRPRPRSQ